MGSFLCSCKESYQRKHAPRCRAFSLRFLLREKSRAHLLVRPFALPLAALTLRSAALGPTLSHATPVAGDSRPRPVGDPSGFLPKPCGAQARQRGLNINTNQQRNGDREESLLN